MFARSPVAPTAVFAMSPVTPTAVFATFPVAPTTFDKTFPLPSIFCTCDTASSITLLLPSIFNVPEPPLPPQFVHVPEQLLQAGHVGHTGGTI